MNYSNIKNYNQRQFDATMKRECITVSDYYDSTKTYDVFFRRSRRGNNPQGKVRIYFSQDTPIDIGTTFVLKDKPYVVTSRDGDESDVFYTSMAVKCDTSFTVHISGKGYVSVPFVTLSDKFTLASSSSFSMVSGSVVVYTGDNLYSREVEVNEKYYNYGGYYKVGNRFFNNGLAYVYMTREAMPTDRYTLSYTGVTSLDMADATTYQLSYTAIKNDVVVDSPALSYVSSDDAIATVDDTGLLTLLATGSVTITATWTDGNNTTCATTIAISNGGVEPTPTTGTLTLSGNSSLKVGLNKTYTATYTDANGNNVSSNYTSVWTITDATFDTSVLTIDTSTQNKCKITCPEDDNLVDNTFTLNVVDSDGTYTPASINITIEYIM